MLAQSDTIGGISFSPPSMIANESCLDQWLSAYQYSPRGEDESYLSYFTINGIGASNCRSWCASSPHCISYLTTSADMCYIYDSLVTEVPRGADSYVDGSRSLASVLYVGGTSTLVHHELGTNSSCYNAFLVDGTVLSDSFMANWVTVADMRPVDSFGTVLQHYQIYDSTIGECRDACVVASHCVSYSIQGTNCYIYDTQVSSGPAGSTFFTGPTTLFGFSSSVGYITYASNRTFTSATAQALLDSRDWVRSLDGVEPFSSSLTYPTHYIYFGMHEDECVQKCTDNVDCIAIVIRDGNCYLYDSSATEAPEGASSFTLGANETSYLLGLGGSCAGAISYSASPAVDETFMNDWISVSSSVPVDSYGSQLQHYRISDISVENCRQW